MANFVLLYTGGSMPATEAERAAVMQAWGAWFGSMNGAVVDGGNPFAPHAKSIASNGSVSDGVSGTPVGGYSILKAESLDGAVALAKGCPLLQGGGQVAVYEVHPAM